MKLGGMEYIRRAAKRAREMGIVHDDEKERKDGDILRWVFQCEHK